MAAVSLATGVNLTSRARLQTQRKHRVTSSVRCAAVQPSKQQQQRRPQHHYHHRHAAVAVGVVDDARRHRVMSGGRGEQLKTCASSVEAVFPGEYEHQTSGKSQVRAACVHTPNHHHHEKKTNARFFFFFHSTTLGQKKMCSLQRVRRTCSSIKGRS